MGAVGEGRIVCMSARYSSKVEVAPFKDNGRLIVKRLEIATELVQRHSSLNRHSDIGLVNGEDLIHLLVRQDDVTTDEARRDGVHGPNDFDFSILSISIFDNCLDFADAAELLELGVRDVELDLVDPVHEARHFGCETEFN